MRRLIASFKADPRKSLRQILAALIMFPAFYCIVMFVDAQPRSAITARGVDLPPTWTAAVLDHGRYYHWWTPDDQPLWFAASCAALVLSLSYILWSIRKRSELR